MNYGDFPLEETIHVFFTTRAFATGIPGTLSAATVAIYEDITATPIQTSVAVTESLNSIAGLNAVPIVATAANGYELGKNYHVVLEAGTVDSVSAVGEVLAYFSIGRSAAAVDLANGTDGLGAIKAQTAAIETDTGQIGTAGAGLTAINLPNQTMDIVGDITGNLSGSAGSVTGAVGSVTAEVTADVTKISGDATAADNLELQYDTTGLAGDTFPATQAQLAGIANVGSAVNTPADSYTLTTGTQSSGTVASTAALDGTNHEHTDDTAAMDLYYEFNVGSGIPVSATVTGYLNSNNDDLEVYGYDWVAAGWVQIGTLAGKNASTNEVNSYELFINMVGTAANEGIVRVRFTDGAFTLTSATLAIDQIFLSFSLGSGGYEDGAVWLDTLKSNTNTVVGIDGTERNPVSTIAAANTLLASTNLRNVHVAPGSSVTFAASQENQVFMGHDWTLALGGQSVSNSYISGATVSGTCTGANEPHFIECKLGAVTAPASIFRRCRLTDAATGITMSTSGGDYIFEQCFSGVAGGGAPKLTFGAGAQTVNFRHYSGGVQNESMIATQTMSLEGDGQFIEGTCTGGAVTIRGNFTVSGITNVTLSDDARIDVAQINAQADTALTDYDPPTHAELVSEINDVQADIAALNDITVADILAGNVEGTHTLAEVLRVIAGAAGGKASGLETTTAVYRNLDDSKDRITATVDEFGNRSAVTLDES